MADYVIDAEIQGHSRRPVLAAVVDNERFYMVNTWDRCRQAFQCCRQRICLIQARDLDNKFHMLDCRDAAAQRQMRERNPISEAPSDVLQDIVDLKPM